MNACPAHLSSAEKDRWYNERTVGTEEHRAKWVARARHFFGVSRNKAVMIYEEALEHERGPFRFGKFSDAVNAVAGRLDGVSSAPAPSRNGTSWDR